VSFILLAPLIHSWFYSKQAPREDGKRETGVGFRYSIKPIVIGSKIMPSRKVWGVKQKDYLEGRSLVKPTSVMDIKDVK
jgi:hypothetical protein